MERVMEVSLNVSEKKPPSGCGFRFNFPTTSDAVGAILLLLFFSFQARYIFLQPTNPLEYRCDLSTRVGLFVSFSQGGHGFIVYNNNIMGSLVLAYI